LLFVKKSQIPGAGRGLFTDTLIKKDAKVIEYTGEIITWAEAEKRDDAGKGGYVFYITKYKCIDAFGEEKGLAQFANDARGLTRKKGCRNNSYYAVRNRRSYIIASRNIKPGEEIFVWYGSDYWKEWLESFLAQKKKAKDEAKAKAAHKKLNIKVEPHHHPKRSTR
jgi:SET domain-containing protein